MAQNHLKFNNYTAPEVDEDGYSPIFAVTSTASSKRTMRGKMKNKVLFTVDGYELKWSNISANEAKSILSEVLGKDDFDFYHFDITKALWRTGKFYVANVDSAVYSLLNGKEKVSQLSFQVTETDPL